MKHKRTVLILLGVLLAVALLAGVLWMTPLRYAIQDMTFSWTEHTETEWKVKEYAEENGVYYSQYPKSLVALLERNPETENFVLNYPFREAGAVDLSAYMTGDTVPLFLQWDPQWGYEKYGSDFLAITGCGPTCLAMVGYYLTGDGEFTPDRMAAFAQKNGYYASGYGSSWTLISQGTGELGLKATELPLVKKKMVDNLEAGNPIILAMGPGDFTTTGHYIVLTGVEDGAFRVNDPNSRSNSEKLWTYEEIEDQIRNIWAIEAA